MLYDPEGRESRLEWIYCEIDKLRRVGDLRLLMEHRDAYARLSAEYLLDGNLVTALHHAEYSKITGDAINEWVAQIQESRNETVPA